MMRHSVQLSRWHQGRLGVTCLIREREDVPQSPINAKQVDSYVFQLPEALSYSAIL